MVGVSIIIPTKNDYDNIIPLVKRIDAVMRSKKITYEILFIDDYSVDLTQQIIKKLSHLFPVTLYLKKSKKEKIFSLLEGVHYASHDIITYIDTKEYNPEVLPIMVKEIQKGFDIVVANRNKKTNTQKQEQRFLFFLWGKRFHNLNVDIDSHLKMFRKEVVQEISLIHPSAHSFWLEFLVRARDAGYKITSIPLHFEKYYADKKYNKLREAIDISLSAIDLKFANADVIPMKRDERERQEKGFLFKGKEFIHYSQIRMNESAFYQLTGKQKKILLSLLFFLTASFFINWQYTLIIILAILTTLYFSDLLFNFYLIAQSFLKPAEIFIDNEIISLNREWPTYTIFCPLYKESAIIGQFVHAIKNLDYPKDKIQVIILLEEDDTETITEIKNTSLPEYFEVKIPPLSNPKTKPKALNYGLQYAKGDYCVVYDAEDIPDTDQLKKIVIAFEKANSKVKCIQAKLSFYNPFQNILTRVFTAEYSLWFDLVLTGLQSTQSPIPLGGTSNHFRTNALRNIHGWDAFNVTEDCDLGLRLTKKGYQTAIVNSTTLEEANSSIANWFSQRGRWIKGYIQTYLVHVRNPNGFIRSARLKQFIAFQLVVGGKVMSLFINPLMWCITIVYFALRPFVGPFIERFFPGPILYLGVICLVFGNFLYLYYYMIGCAKKRQYALIKYAFLVPFYWLAMSASGWIALYKIITQPHHWAKTHHGLHLQKKKSIFYKIKTILTIPIPKPQVSL